MHRFLYLAIALFSFSQANAAMTFGDLANDCRIAVERHEAGESAAIHKDMQAAISAEKCWSYLNSFQEALAWAAIKKAGMNKPEPSMQDIFIHLPYCLPDNVSTKQQALMIINHADRNPPHKRWAAGAVFGEIMLRQYPCPAQK